MVNPRKAYPVDPALIPLYDRSGRANLGHALETVVMLEFERRRMAVTYVRTKDGHEVDFLARSLTGDVELIQVCADASDAATAQRELRALTGAREQYRRAQCRLLTLTGDARVENVPKDVVLEPAWAWMLRGA